MADKLPNIVRFINFLPISNKSKLYFKKKKSGKEGDSEVQSSSLGAIAEDEDTCF